MACRSAREAWESPASGSPAQAGKKAGFNRLAMCSNVDAISRPGGGAGGAPVLLEETESRWVLGSAALPASGLTRPGLHPAPGTSGVDALGSRGQKIGVPGGELQPKSCCSDREHPERSCCSPRSSPLEGNAPSFLLPGSPPTLARTRGAHGHFSAKPFGGFGGWRGGPGGERLTGEEGDSSAGRRCHAGVPWLDANTQPGPLPGAGVGRDLDGRRLRVRNIFTGICHHLQTFFSPPLSP